MNYRALCSEINIKVAFRVPKLNLFKCRISAPVMKTLTHTDLDNKAPFLETFSSCSRLFYIQ